MKTLVVLAKDPFDIKEKAFSIGGVQTYISSLAAVARDNGYRVIICEHNRYDSTSGVIVDNGIEIRYRPYPFKKLRKKLNYQAAFDYWIKELNGQDTVFVVETDQLTYKSRLSNVIQIQHGVAFDIPRNYLYGIWRRAVVLQRLKKALSCIKNVSRLHQVKNTVCVDYNYYNWFRTLGTIHNDENVTVIPNFSSGAIPIAALESKIQRAKTESRRLNIVYARRFVEHRGALMFAKVVRRLLDEKESVNVTFAGEGPCIGEMRSIIGDDASVSFTSFRQEDSIKFHEQFDLTVVPTIYSEGTSLSLCEAMSAGCVPLVTHIGGMTNMVIDSYNGFLVAPSEDELYHRVKKVIHLPKADLSRVSKNAYDTATQAFGFAQWGKRWMAFLDEVVANSK